MRQPQHVDGLIPLYDDLYMQVGQSSFSGSNTTVEVRTPLSEIVAAACIPTSYSGTAAAGGEVLFCDGVVSSGAVTVSQKAAVDSGLTFFYIFIGRKAS